MSPGSRKYACSECGTRPSMVRAAATSAWPMTCPPKTLRPPRSVDCPRKRFNSSCSRSSWRMSPCRVGSMSAGRLPLSGMNRANPAANDIRRSFMRVAVAAAVSLFLLPVLARGQSTPPPDDRNPVEKAGDKVGGAADDAAHKGGKAAGEAADSAANKAGEVGRDTSRAADRVGDKAAAAADDAKAGARRTKAKSKEKARRARNDAANATGKAADDVGDAAHKAGDKAREGAH